jgi:hypothetical protein
MSWDLAEILSELNSDIAQKLERVRRTIDHSSSKGDASEDVWLQLFNEYLPDRYQSDKAHVVDSEGMFSDQIDIVVYDRQYSPFIFIYGGQKVIPAESVYAIFEAKQSINASNVDYAHGKVASVRKLHRTSIPIPHAGGEYPAKEPNHIIGGILTLDSDWNPSLSNSLLDALNNSSEEGKLDIGCVAAEGFFFLHREDRSNTEARAPNLEEHYLIDKEKPATAFLFRLISMLQKSATVPMIDIDAYAEWL